MWMKARNRKAKRLLRKAGEMAQDDRCWWPTSGRGEQVARLIGVAAVRAACRRAMGL
jgi:hypothetical protein